MYCPSLVPRPIDGPGYEASTVPLIRYTELIVLLQNSEATVSIINTMF